MRRDLIDAIQRLTKKQLEDQTESKYTILAHTCEELGEVSRAMCIEDSSRVKAHKQLDEPSYSEAIDLMICAASLVFANGGTADDIDRVTEEKLAKWEKTFEINKIGEKDEKQVYWGIKTLSMRIFGRSRTRKNSGIVE